MSRTPFAWRYTLREIRRRPIRSLLTLVGIVLGVAAAAAVTLGTSATRAAYPGMFDALAGEAAIELRASDGHSPFAVDLARVENMSGVAAAAPVIQVPAALTTSTGPVPLLIFGIDPERDRQIRTCRIREGGNLGEGAWLEAGFARKHGLKLGDTAKLMTSRGPTDLPVTGLLEASGPAKFNGGAIAVLELRTAQKILGIPGKVSAVSVFAPGASEQQVRSRLAEAFPDLTVGAPTDRGHLADEFLGSIEQALASLGAIAAIAGGLVILNTFLMHLGERRRQLALLRALGATRTQVMGLLLRQALLLGGVGTVLGLLLGIFLAWLLVRLHENFMTVPMPGLRLSWRGLLPALLLGPTMTLAATLWPARRASRRDPLADLRGRTPPEDGPSRWVPITGGLLLAVVFAFVLAIVRGWLSGTAGTRLLPFMSAAGLVGCTCLLPLVQGPLLRLIGLGIVPLFGVEGRLAIRHLLRHPSRTGLTVGVLFAAITACLAFGLSMLNNTNDIRNWYRSAVDADFLVRAVQPDPALVLTSASLPAGTEAKVRALPGFRSADRIRFIPTRSEGVSLLILARDLTGESLPLLVHEGEASTLADRLRAGEVALGTALANRLGIGIGGHITLPTSHGPRRFRVGGLVKEYSVAGMTLVMDYTKAQESFDFASPNALAVNAQSGQAETLGAALADSALSGYWVQSKADFEAFIERVVVGVRWLLGGLMALIAGVAAVGVVNTLTTNVLDQTRELGVLRSLGMKRGGVVKLVLAQSVSLALTACLAGGPAGVLIAWLMNVTTPGLQGHYVPFRVEPVFVSACLVGTVVLAVLAAWLPARRAGRLLIVDAVRYE